MSVRRVKLFFWSDGPARDGDRASSRFERFVGGRPGTNTPGQLLQSVASSCHNENAHAIANQISGIIAPDEVQPAVVCAGNLNPGLFHDRLPPS
jgi:organic hydroperoxide reductase OsmC/OhrA